MKSNPSRQNRSSFHAVDKRGLLRGYPGLNSICAPECGRGDIDAGEEVCSNPFVARGDPAEVLMRQMIGIVQAFQPKTAYRPFMRRILKGSSGSMAVDGRANSDRIKRAKSGSSRGPFAGSLSDPDHAFLLWRSRSAKVPELGEPAYPATDVHSARLGRCITGNSIEFNR